MKKALLFLIVLIPIFQINAQDFLGLQSSNYAGVTGAYSNPANIVDGRFVVDVALFGLHLDAGNNYFGIKEKAAKVKVKINPTGKDPNSSGGFGPLSFITDPS